MKIRSLSVTKKIGKPPFSFRKKMEKQAERSKESAETGLGEVDWAYTDVREVRDQIAVQKMQSGANRPPELYIKDGESKRLRFRDDEPIAAIWQYSAKVNGKWTSHTMPADGEKNYYQKAGLKPSLKLVYEVIDLDGFTDRNGKKMRNVVRFLKVSGRLHEQLNTIAKKRGGLTGFIIELGRSGQSTQTTYSVYPETPSKTSPELLKLPRLRKDFKKYYAPLPPEQQKAIVGALDDDDETPY